MQALKPAACTGVGEEYALAFVTCDSLHISQRFKTEEGSVPQYAICLGSPGFEDQVCW